MYTIQHNGVVLAAGGSIEDIEKGLKFYGDGSEMLQWGMMWYDAGKILQPHIHKILRRNVSHPTQEFLYIIQGSIEATFYTREKQVVEQVKLSAGDFICLYDGGHGFKVLEDNTKFIEVKHGPFITVEKDKEKF